MATPVNLFHLFFPQPPLLPLPPASWLMLGEHLIVFL